MKRFAVVVAVLLTGCAYNMTLYPKGGGETANGTFSHSSMTAEVMLKGATYKGDMRPGQSFGMAFKGATFTPIMMSSSSFSGVLLGGGKAMRCEIALSGNQGSGLCVDSDNLPYDVVLKMN